MKKKKIRTFQERLAEDLKNPEFRRHYKEEKNPLMKKQTILAERNGCISQTRSGKRRYALMSHLDRVL